MQSLESLPCICPRCARHRTNLGPRPLLVGELNPRAGEDYLALFPNPRSSSGGRLAMILGLTPERYLETFDRANLCRGEWHQRAATDRAGELAREHEAPSLILLGRRVAAAFGLDFEPFTVRRGPGALYAQLPHPSGLNRAWNSPLTVELARRTIGYVLRASRP